jgi:peptide/nickel transport system substrate-binding protein
MRTNGFATLLLTALLAVCGARADGVRAEPPTGAAVNPPTLNQPAPADGTGVDWDATVYRALQGNPHTLSPIFRSSLYEFYIAELLSPPLVVWDEQMRWRVHPDLVESYEESDDHTTATVKLKPGLKWHDGRPLTAEDVVFSWRAILDERVPIRVMRVGTDQIAECKALDSRTIRFTYKEPSAVSRENLGFSIVARHVYEPGQHDDPTLRDSDYFNRVHRNPIGYGPYRFVEWVDNDRIVLERWDDYAGRRPYIKRVVFRIVPDANSALMMLKKGELDEMPLQADQFAAASADELFGRAAVRAFAPRWDYVYVGWNQDGSNPFFDDAQVRRAMTLATNVPLMIESIYHNLVTPCLGIYHPDHWAFDTRVKRITYSTQQAAKTLDDAGWLVSDEDGWRYKDGVKFEFTMLLAQGSEAGPPVAAILQEDLRSIGVAMNTQTLEWATFLQRIRGHDFHAYVGAWGMDPDPDSGWNIWRSDQYDSGRNYVGYSNPRVDALYEKARASFDHDFRRECYREIQRLIYADQPYTFLWHRASLWAFNKRLRGVRMSPRGIGNFYPGMLDWWVPAGASAPHDS